MLAVPNDTRDFAYTVSFFKVTVGGTLKVKLIDGTVTVLTVRTGEYVNLPIRRIYRTGTTASGFQNELFAGNDAAVRGLAVPYSPARDSALLADTGAELYTDDGIQLFA